MKSQVITVNLTDLFKSLPKEQALFIEEQMNSMYENCYNTKNIVSISLQNYNPVHRWFIDIIPETLEVRGFFTLFPSKNNPKRSEIYNVCIKPVYRGQKVLQNLFSYLDKTHYYLLQVLFDNERAQRAYLNNFFCDFIGIGVLSYGGEVTFVMGGTPNTDCSQKKQKLLPVMKSITEKVQFLKSNNISIDGIYKHILQYYPIYDFYLSNYALLEAMKDLKSPFVKVTYNDEYTKLINSQDFNFLIKNTPEIVESIVIYLKKIN